MRWPDISRAHMRGSKSAGVILAMGLAISAHCWVGFSVRNREKPQSNFLSTQDKSNVPTRRNKTKSIEGAISESNGPHKISSSASPTPGDLNRSSHGHPEVLLSRKDHVQPDKEAKPKPLKEAKTIGEAMDPKRMYDVQGEKPPLHLYRHTFWFSRYLSWTIAFLIVAGLCWWLFSNWRWMKSHSQFYNEDKVAESPVVLEDKTIDREGQILTYDMGQLSKSSVIFQLFGYGTFFSRWKVWRQVGCYLLLWLLLVLNFNFLVQFYQATANGPIASLSQLLMGTMPFFLAMYINTAFNRWWTILTGCLGGVWQNVNQLCFLMSSHLKGEQFQDQRAAMLRYGLLAHALLYQTLRKKFDLQALVAEGLLDEAEVQPLNDLKGPKCHAVWMFIQDLWTELYKDKHIEWWLLQQAQGFTTDGRRACKGAMTYVNCKLPYGWVHLITCMVNINLFFIVFKVSAFSATAIGSLSSLGSIGETPCMIMANGGLVCGGEAFRALIKLFCQAATIAVSSFLYIGFLEVANELSDPFGCEAHDFPRFAWMAGMRNENSDYFALAGKGTNKPVLPKPQPDGEQRPQQSV